MKKLFLRAKNSQLVKTSILNGIANAVKILTSLVSSKIAAVYLGPSGVALLGQFQNFTQMAMTLSTVGINAGTTKYTAEYYDDPAKRKAILSTGLMMTFAGVVIVSSVVFLGRGYFSRILLHTDQYVSVFGILAVTLVLFALNAYFMAVLNGFKEFKKVVGVNMATSVIGLLIAIILVISYGVYGAFLGVILSQTLVFFITLTFVIKSPWFSWTGMFFGFHKESAIKLGKFSLMAFTSLFAVTFIQLQIRNFIIAHVSMADAGYWQGITRISDLYLMFITTTLSIYYLPRLSELKTKAELRHEVIKVYKFVLPLTIATSFVIYVLQDWIIRILLADTFIPMKPLFLFQLIGNVLRMGAWVLGYVLIAKAMTRVFIITELVFGLSLYLVTIFFVSKTGVVGATYAYALNYFIYLTAMVIIFRNFLRKEGMHGETDYGVGNDVDL
jgi:PST family polysaccharide transporter